MLEHACQHPKAGPTGDPRFEATVSLAQGSEEELLALADALAGADAAAAVTTVEGALLAADLSNLAACAAPGLPDGSDARAAALAAAHLASGAARALHALVEAGSRSQGTEDGGRYAFTDARSAVWRARIAARQADDLLGLSEG
jgi:hypothetical protein